MLVVASLYGRPSRWIEAFGVLWVEGACGQSVRTGLRSSGSGLKISSIGASNTADSPMAVFGQGVTGEVTGAGCLVWSVCGLSGWLGLFIVLPGEGLGVIWFILKAGSDFIASSRMRLIAFPASTTSALARGLTRI